MLIACLPCRTAISEVHPRISFSPPSNIPVNSRARLLKVADIDNDGNLDIFVGDRGITLLFGDGSGNFGRRTNLSSSKPDALVVQDFNNDGYLDIASAVSDTLTIFLGRPGGGFLLSSNYVLPFGSGSATCADFTGDGVQDVVCVDDNAWEMVLMRGMGDGTFAQERVFDSPYCFFALAADLDNDDKPELVSTCGDGGHVLRIADNGTFTNATEFGGGSGWGADELVAADMDNDGYKDLVTTRGYPSNVSVFLNDGSGRFTPHSACGTGAGSFTVAVFDADSDGFLDVATANRDAGTMTVLRNDGRGGLLYEGDFKISQSGDEAYGIAVGDFNGDGRPDVAVTQNDNAQIALLFNESVPRLRATARVGQIELSWPNVSGFVVEGTTNLLNPSAWEIVSGQTETVEARRILLLSNTEPLRFFRLRN